MALKDLFKNKESRKVQSGASEKKEDDAQFIRNFLKANYPKREQMVRELLENTGKMKLIFKLRKIAAGIRDRNPPFSDLYIFETLAMNSFSGGFVGKWAASVAYNKYYEQRVTSYDAELRALAEKGFINSNHLVPLISHMAEKDGPYMPLLFIDDRIRTQNEKIATLLHPIEEGVIAVKRHDSIDPDEDLQRLKRNFIGYLAARGRSKAELYIQRIEFDNRLSIHVNALRALLKEKDELASGTDRISEESGEKKSFYQKRRDAPPVDQSEYDVLRGILNQSASGYRATKDKEKLKNEIYNTLRKIRVEKGLDYAMAIINRLIDDPELDSVAVFVVRKIREVVVEKHPEFANDENSEKMNTTISEADASGFADSISKAPSSHVDMPENRAESIMDFPEDHRIDEEKLLRFRDRLKDYQALLQEKEDDLNQSIGRLITEVSEKDRTRKVVDLLNDPYLTANNREYLFSTVEKTNSLLSRIIRYIDRISKKLTRKELRGYLDKLIQDLQQQSDITKKHPSVIQYLWQYRDSLRTMPGHLLQTVHIALSNIRSRYPKHPIRASLEQLALLDDYLNNPEYEPVYMTLINIYKNILNQDLDRDILNKIRNSSGDEQPGFLKSVRATLSSDAPGVASLQEIEQSYDFKRRNRALENEMKGGSPDMRSVTGLLEKDFDGDPIRIIKQIIRDPEFRPVKIEPDTIDGTSLSDEGEILGSEERFMPDDHEKKKERSAKRLNYFLKNQNSPTSHRIKNQILDDPDLPSGLRTVLLDTAGQGDVKDAIRELETRNDSPELSRWYFKALRHIAKGKDLLNESLNQEIHDKLQDRETGSESQVGRNDFTENIDIRKEEQIISKEESEELEGSSPMSSEMAPRMANHIPASVEALIDQAVFGMGDLPMSGIDGEEYVGEMPLPPATRDDLSLPASPESQGIKSDSRHGKGTSKPGSLTKPAGSARRESKPTGSILGGFLDSLLSDEKSKKAGSFSSGKGVGQKQGNHSGPGEKQIGKKGSTNSGSFGSADIKKIAKSLESQFLERVPEKGKPKSITDSIPSQKDLEEQIKQRSEFKNVSGKEADEAAMQVRKQMAVSVMIPQELQSSAPGTAICFPKKVWLNEVKRRNIAEAFRKMSEEFPPGSKKQRYYLYVADEMEMNYYDKKYKI